MTPGKSVALVTATPGAASWGEVAALLAEAGHRVSWLLTRPDLVPPHRLGPWIDFWAGRGVELVPLPVPDYPLVHTGPGCARSHAVLEWLCRRRADTVCFDDRGGAGYYALVARRQGLGFAGTRMLVRVTRPTAWSLRVAQHAELDPADSTEAEFMERRSAGLADAVLVGHAGLGHWLRGVGWALTADPVVLPDLSPPTSPAVDGMEFLVREESDLHLAAAALAGGDASLVTVRLLAGDGDGTLAALAGRLGLTVVAGDAPVPARRIVAALSENDPCPGSAAPVLLVPQGVFAEGAIPFARHPTGLAAALERARTMPDRVLPDPDAARRAWLDALLAGGAPGPPAAVCDGAPLSVCLVHHRRPALLRQAVSSILAQTVPPDEVVLVDDGSADPASQTCLDELQPAFDARGWRILRQENRYLGAARNAAAAAARGALLLFLDDDNLLAPEAVAVFRQVRAATGADVVTCFADLFDGADPPPEGAPPRGRIVPAGGSAALGLFRNAFGDATALVSRACFDAVGGFTEGRDVGHEDWEFFARAVLKGFRLEVAAAPLLRYRRHQGGSMLKATAPAANLRRALDPYLEHADPALLPLLLALRAQRLRQGF